MSGADALGALGALAPSTGAPPINQATEPANIRNGGAKAQQAYATALQFEQVLVNQLTQRLTDSAGLTDSTGSGSSSDGSDTSGGLGSGPGLYSQLLPGTLTSSIMSSGGLGNLADTLATAIDPAIGQSSGPATTVAATPPGGTAA